MVLIVEVVMGIEGVVGLTNGGVHGSGRGGSLAVRIVAEYSHRRGGRK